MAGNVHYYLLAALEAAPDLFDHLLAGLTEEEADRRPDPDRFTIREAMAHLADWEGVFGERLARTLSEDRPLLQGYDEGQWAIENDYAHKEVAAERERFRAGRAKMVALLRDVHGDPWQRVGEHSELGAVTVQDQATLVAAHDTYHLRQMAAWRTRR